MEQKDFHLVLDFTTFLIAMAGIAMFRDQTTLAFFAFLCGLSLRGILDR